LEQFQLCVNITDGDDDDGVGVKLKGTIKENIQQYDDRDMTPQTTGI
jgi:hypothetical protein